jgi:hypothetical protein
MTAPIRSSNFKEPSPESFLTRFDFPEYMFKGQRYSTITVRNPLDTMREEIERKQMEANTIRVAVNNSFQNEWDTYIRPPQTARFYINNMP